MVHKVLLFLYKLWGKSRIYEICSKNIAAVFNKTDMNNEWNVKNGPPWHSTLFSRKVLLKKYWRFWSKCLVHDDLKVSRTGQGPQMNVYNVITWMFVALLAVGCYGGEVVDYLGSQDNKTKLYFRCLYFHGFIVSIRVIEAVTFKSGLYMSKSFGEKAPCSSRYSYWDEWEGF